MTRRPASRELRSALARICPTPEDLDRILPPAERGAPKPHPSAIRLEPMPGYNGGKQLRRLPISPRTRFAILQRDKFTCQLCGASAAHDRVALHVDHMQPVAKGGTNDEANLWTLCAGCNIAKSDKV